MSHDELCPPTDDDDLTLPRASINKMIKELVSVDDISEQIKMIIYCNYIQGSFDTSG